MEKLDGEESPEFDHAGLQAALEKLKHHPEPEVGFMVRSRHTQPAYNLQSAVDAEHALIIAHARSELNLAVIAYNLNGWLMSSEPTT